LDSPIKPIRSLLSNLQKTQLEGPALNIKSHLLRYAARSIFDRR